MTVLHKSEVLNLSEMVDYQTGAVISRQISKNEAGNITLFAFDQGQELSEHTSPFDAFVQVLEGQIELRVSGVDYLLGPAQAILMPGGEPHALRAKTQFKMLLTMLRA
jgi:quercetin dioxygenase-like cupin family protein